MPRLAVGEGKLGFYDNPAEHWIHDRAGLRHRAARTNVTKDPGSQGAGLAIALKLIDSAPTCWQAVAHFSPEVDSSGYVANARARKGLEPPRR